MRADGRQRVADLVGDAGREQAERRHLFLVEHVGLGLLQFAGPLGDACFQLGLVFLQRRLSWPRYSPTRLSSSAMALLAQVTQPRMTSVRAKRHGVLPLGRQGQVQQAVTETVQGAGGVGDLRGVADGTADERQEIVVAERAFQAARRNSTAGR